MPSLNSSSSTFNVPANERKAGLALLLAAASVAPNDFEQKRSLDKLGRQRYGIEGIVDSVAHVAGRSSVSSEQEMNQAVRNIELVAIRDRLRRGTARLGAEQLLDGVKLTSPVDPVEAALEMQHASDVFEETRQYRRTRRFMPEAAPTPASRIEDQYMAGAEVGAASYALALADHTMARLPVAQVARMRMSLTDRERMRDIAGQAIRDHAANAINLVPTEAVIPARRKRVATHGR